jgi:hypothetical protein
MAVRIEAERSTSEPRGYLAWGGLGVALLTLGYVGIALFQSKSLRWGLGSLLVVSGTAFVMVGCGIGRRRREGLIAGLARDGPLSSPVPPGLVRSVLEHQIASDNASGPSAPQAVAAPTATVLEQPPPAPITAEPVPSPPQSAVDPLEAADRQEPPAATGEGVGAVTRATTKAHLNAVTELHVLGAEIMDVGIEQLAQEYVKLQSGEGEEAAAQRQTRARCALLLDAAKLPYGLRVPVEERPVARVWGRMRETWLRRLEEGHAQPSSVRARAETWRLEARVMLHVVRFGTWQTSRALSSWVRREGAIYFLMWYGKAAAGSRNLPILLAELSQGQSAQWHRDTLALVQQQWETQPAAVQTATAAFWGMVDRWAWELRPSEMQTVIKDCIPQQYRR